MAAADSRDAAAVRGMARRGAPPSGGVVGPAALAATDALHNKIKWLQLPRRNRKETAHAPKLWTSNGICTRCDTIGRYSKQRELLAWYAR